MARQKETAVNLAKFIDKSIIVKLAGGREGAQRYCALIKQQLKCIIFHVAAAAHFNSIFEYFLHSWHAVIGVLKGYDQLLNLVLDESTEYMRGASKQLLEYFPDNLYSQLYPFPPHHHHTD